jgi:hypothetical protein
VLREDKRLLNAQVGKRGITTLARSGGLRLCRSGREIEYGTAIGCWPVVAPARRPRQCTRRTQSQRAQGLLSKGANAPIHQIHSKMERLSLMYKYICFFLISMYFIEGLMGAYAFIVFLFATPIPKSSSRVTYSTSYVISIMRHIREKISANSTHYKVHIYS